MNFLETKLGKLRRWERVRTFTCRSQEDDDVNPEDQFSPATDNQPVAPIEDKVIRHGIYLSKRISLTKSIKQLVFNPATKQFVILFDCTKIVVYNEDGEMQEYSTGEKVDGLTFVPKVNRYILWSKDGIMKVLDSSLNLLNKIPVTSQIYCITDNPFANDVITGNKGQVMSWTFRSAHTVLVPKLTIKTFMNPEDEITFIAIEETTSKEQRCFAVVKNGVLVIRLRDGACSAKLLELHKTSITCVVFFKPMKLLVTSGQDGSIKTWSETGSLRTVFIGHTKCVNKVIIYKYGPLFFSISSDETLRIWNLDTNDAVDVISVGSKVIGIGQYDTVESVYTFTESDIYTCGLSNVYRLATAVGSRVKAIKSTTYPEIPMRSILICKDSCVRITCPKNGAVITSLLLPEGKVIQDAVYAISKAKRVTNGCPTSYVDILFVLLKDGTIIKSSTLSNPCKILEKWDSSKMEASPLCKHLCLYEYIVQKQVTGNKWRGLVQQAQGKKYAEGHPEILEDGTIKMGDSFDRIILFGGCEDGRVVMYEWQNSKSPGKVTFSLQAHSDSVVSIRACPQGDQVVTAGADKIIKLWRVFPFTQQALGPLTRFVSSEMATHLTLTERRLCVAFQNTSTVSYTIAMFKTNGTVPARLNHSTDEEHADTIVGISSCPKMRIFCSASIDGTVRIWNEANEFLRLINLNAVPHAIDFCSQRGDILVAIGYHVYKIPYAAYLPTPYVYQMAVLEFMEPSDDAAIPMTEESLSSLTADQRNRLLKARSSLFKLNEFVDDLSEEEMRERQKEHSSKLRECALLAARDEELNALVNGIYPERKRYEKSAKVKNEAWLKYLGLFYNRELLKIPEESSEIKKDPFQRPVSILAKRYVRPAGEAKKLCLTTNSFIKQSRSPSRLIVPVAKDTRSLSIAVDPKRELVIGGSRDVRRAHSAPWKRETASKATDEEEGDASILSSQIEKEMKQIGTKVFVTSTNDRDEAIRCLSRAITDSVTQESMLRSTSPKMPAVAPDGYLPNSVIAAMYRESERKKEETEIKESSLILVRPKGLTHDQLQELLVYRRKTLNLLHEETEELDGCSSSRYLPTLKSWESRGIVEALETHPLSPSTCPVQEDQLTVKDELPRTISPLKPIKKLVPLVSPRATSPQPRTPEPPPLPEFITQFFDETWFKQCFDLSHLKQTSVDWTLRYFVSQLLSHVKTSDDTSLQLAICEAIHTLLRQMEISVDISKLIENEMLPFLDSTHQMPSNELRRKLITSCLRLLVSVSKLEVTTILELMSQYVLGNAQARIIVMAALESNGLVDPNSYFKKQMCEFLSQSSSKPFENRKPYVNQLCCDWLETWTRALQKHIISLTGKVYRAPMGPPSSSTELSEKPSRSKRSLKQKTTKVQQGVSLTMSVSSVSEDFMNSAAKNCTPIEAINYFCEIQREAELQRMREPEKMPEEKVDSSRREDTVLRLPPIEKYSGLVRLGETHTSMCHPQREAVFSDDSRKTYDEKSTGDVHLHRILLRKKILNLNPFPEEMDDLLYDPYGHSPLITMRSARKYFYVESTYVAYVDQT